MKLLPLALLLLVAPAHAQRPKPKPKPAQKPTVGVKGASQLSGGAIRFGELFALKSGFTFQILSARYTLDPFDGTPPLSPEGEEKLLILTVAIKNNRKAADNWFNSEGHVFQLVDNNNQNYEGYNFQQKSKPGVAFSPTLKPGQGIGQPGNDVLEVAVKLPLKARLVKIILKQGREGTSEEVLRFFLADATEAEAGGKPDPKNIIAPLPSVAAPDAIAQPGTSYPSHLFFFQLTGFASADSVNGQAAEDGKKWVFANVLVKNALAAKQSLFDFYAGDSISQLVLVDSDGEKYPAYQFLKAKRDEPAEGELDPGEERAFRIAFQVPKNATFKTVLLGSPRGHRYRFDASAAGK